MGAAASCFGIDNESHVSHSSQRYRRGCIGGFASNLCTRLFRRKDAVVERSLMIPKDHDHDNDNDNDDDDDNLCITTWRAPPMPPPFNCPNSTAANSSDCTYAYACPYDDDDDDVCPICLEEYSPEDPAMELQCSHKFHLGCTFEWMERSTTCPICEKVMELKETA